jgi:uncharacterized protein
MSMVAIVSKLWARLNAVRCLFALVAVLGSSAVLADASVWQVTAGANSVYLGGSVHLLRATDFPLPDEYEQAYQSSETIVFETDLASMGDISVQAQMLQQLTYSDDRSLKTVLNNQAYTALSEYAAEIGMPMMLMEKFKPGMVVSTLQLLEFQRLGFTPEGVDTYFNNRAMADSKTLGALETIAQQIGYLADMGEGAESEFILLSLQDLAETDEQMDEMVRAWREGDIADLNAMFVDEMRQQAPDLYDSLLKQRNLNWIPQIETMLRDSDTEFVLVGAAHLVGPEGLLQLLRSAGYQVTQL